MSLLKTVPSKKDALKAIKKSREEIELQRKERLADEIVYFKQELEDTVDEAIANGEFPNRKLIAIPDGAASISGKKYKIDSLFQPILKELRKKGWKPVITREDDDEGYGYFLRLE